MEYSTSKAKLNNINIVLSFVTSKLTRLNKHLATYPQDVQAMQAQMNINRVLHFYLTIKRIQEMRLVASEYLLYRRQVLKSDMNHTSVSSGNTD